MSIHTLIAAAYVADLDPGRKWVLAAIADSADEYNHESAPGLPKIMAWSGLSESRAKSIITELIAARYIERISKGRIGRRAVYRVFPDGVPAIPHPSEVAARYALSTPVDNPVEQGAVDGTSEPRGCHEAPARVPPAVPLHASTSVSRARPVSKPVDSRPAPPAASGFPGARKAASEERPDPRTQRGHHDQPCPVGDHGARGEIAGGCGRCAHAAVNSNPDRVAEARALARKHTQAARRPDATEEQTA